MSSETAKTFCENCSQYIESSKFFLHERMCSLNVKKCPKCNKPFSIDDLEDHIKQEHSLIICDLCNITFNKSEIEKHRANCNYRLIPCKYCELNVIFQELEEHENICGSTTQKCEKCELFIEKKYFLNHICQKKQNEYFNENIQIDMIEDDKKQKKKNKNTTMKKNKKNKKLNQIETSENDDLFFYGLTSNQKKFGDNKDNKKNKEQQEIIDDEEGNNKDEIDIKLIFDKKEIKNQKKMLNHFEKINKNKEDKKEDKKEKKKNKKKNKKEKEEQKEEEKQLTNNKKGKKTKLNQNNKILNKDEIFDEDENDSHGNKKINLHNLKFDIPPEEYENYNNPKYNYNYGYIDYEEKMINEAIKLSLLDK